MESLPLQQQSQPSTKKKKSKYIKINSSNAKSHITLLQYLISKNKHYKETLKENCDIFWTASQPKDNQIDRFYKAQVNRLPGMRTLADKTSTTYILNYQKQLNPSRIRFLP